MCQRSVNLSIDNLLCYACGIQAAHTKFTNSPFADRQTDRQIEQVCFVSSCQVVVVAHMDIFGAILQKKAIVLYLDCYARRDEN